jgi:hypothetical protein
MENLHDLKPEQKEKLAKMVKTYAKALSGSGGGVQEAFAGVCFEQYADARAEMIRDNVEEKRIKFLEENGVVND